MGNLSFSYSDKPRGLLQQSEVPIWKWDNIIMDFVTQLWRSARRHNDIWVVVYRLTKRVHFLLVNQKLHVSKFVELYIKEIVRMHGVTSRPNIT